MEKLKEIVKTTGTGFKDNYATLIERTDKVCLYKRSDEDCNVYEVFIVKITPEGMTFGKHYPERESYPGNEDFGKTAWCISNNSDRAYSMFQELVEQVNNKEADSKYTVSEISH